jgi:hypothetical protein
LSCWILSVTYEIFELLDIDSHVFPLILNSREPIPDIIESLRGARNGHFLTLQPIDENLCPLRRDDCRVHILPQLTYFEEQCLQGLGVARGCLSKAGCPKKQKDQRK